MPAINQGFVPGFNALFKNILNKVGKTVISSNIYDSPFSRFVQNLEVGEYIENLHINPGPVLLQDTINNSNFLNDYHDDISSAYSAVNIDMAFPSTYTEYRIREAATLLENVSSIITALIANIKTTFEYRRNEEVKQMLFNGWSYGMFDTVNITDPTVSPDDAGAFAVALNSAIDDFRTEISTRDIPYNNIVGLPADEKRKVVSNNMPIVITFNNYIRYSEFWNAINLAWVGRFRTENSNMDWQNRIIALNVEDFPSSIPATNRSEVVGQNVSADGINFYEMPKDMRTNTNLYSGSPIGPGNTILAFVLDPDALMLETQLEITTNFLNPGSLSNTTRLIYRGVEDINVFKKVRVITCTK